MAKVEIDQVAFGRYVDRQLVPEISRRLQVAVERAREFAPVDKGSLRDSIGYSIDYSGPDGVRGRIFASAPHAGVIHRGRQAVTSTDPMVFIASGGGKVFSHVAAAVPPNPFLVNAVRATFGSAYRTR